MRVKSVQLTDLEHLQSAVDNIDGAQLVSPAGTPVATVDEATGKHRLYGGSPDGVGIRLPGWRYPVVVDPATGVVTYDNYGGSWGAEDELDGLVQGYCIEKTRAEAMMQNLQMVQEQPLDDGTIELTFALCE